MKSLILRIFGFIIRIYKKLGVIKALSLVLVVIFTLVAIKITSDKESAVVSDNLKSVRTESVLSLSGEKTSLSLIGKVESRNEADLRAETQGEVTGVYASLGERVYAGEILAEISNARERAMVLQAEALLEGARSAEKKITTGARSQERDILSTSLDSASKSYNDAFSSAKNALENAYATADDIIFNKVDRLFTNPRTNSPHLSFVIADAQTIIDSDNGRLAVGYMMDRWEDEIATVMADASIKISLVEAEKNLNILRDFLNTIARAVNTMSPTADISATMVSTWQSNILSARSSVNSLISSVISARTSISNAESALEIAEQNKDIGFTGGRDEDVISAQSAVKQAEANLAAAIASLEKTQIRTPISGVLNLFSVRKGDFVTLYEPIAVVSNNNALVVTTYITEEERADIQIGDKVILEKNTTGTIVAIAPGLNPLNKKIEVTINPENSVSSLINGETVRISLERAYEVNKTALPERMSIPIKALKVEPSRTLVFSVDPNTGKLVGHKVILGQIMSEKVVITDGIDFNLEIVTDARGLKEGEKVVVR